MTPAAIALSVGVAVVAFFAGWYLRSRRPSAPDPSADRQLREADAALSLIHI